MQTKKSIKRENFKAKAHSGITLIALVITIIVLLILAGVALNTLIGDNGILNNAESAKDKTNLGNAKEQIELAVQGALIKGYSQGDGIITKDNLKKELDNIVGVIDKDYTLRGEQSLWIVTIGKYETLVYANGNVEKNENLGGIVDEDVVGNRDITTLPSREGTTPWLPEGFSQVAGTSLDTGLTIANTADGTSGTQNYVWIEIPTTISANINGTTVALAEAQRYNEILEILEVYAGKGTLTNYRHGDYKDEWYDSAGKNKDVKGVNLNDTAGCGMTYDEYNQTYKKMLSSIKKYGGFWLAQYEAGIEYEKGGAYPTNRTGYSDRITDNPTSANYAKDQYPYIYVYCSEAQKIANADSTSSYTSSLPFGIQWDLVCKFLEIKTNLNYTDIATNSTWGNYYNTYWTSSDNSKYSDDIGESFTQGRIEKSAGYYLLTTGAIDKTILAPNEYNIANPMNIYDFAGNIFEWTLEHATAYNEIPCSGRGGSYADSGSNYHAAYRLDCVPTQGVDEGFRSTLY